MAMVVSSATGTFGWILVRPNCKVFSEGPLEDVPFGKSRTEPLGSVSPSSVSRPPWANASAGRSRTSNAHSCRAHRLLRAREGQEKHRSQKLRLATWRYKARRQDAAISCVEVLRLGFGAAAAHPDDEPYLISTPSSSGVRFDAFQPLSPPPPPIQQTRLSRLI